MDPGAVQRVSDRMSTRLEGKRERANPSLSFSPHTYIHPYNVYILIYIYIMCVSVYVIYITSINECVVWRIPTMLK